MRPQATKPSTAAAGAKGTGARNDVHGVVRAHQRGPQQERDDNVIGNNRGYQPEAQKGDAEDDSANGELDAAVTR